MKRTELEKRERKLKQSQKKSEVLARKTAGTGKPSVNEYIDRLLGMLRYDANEVFNTKNDINILELFEEIKNTLPEKQWENVVRKAVKQTNAEQKDRAVAELLEFMKDA